MSTGTNVQSPCVNICRMDAESGLCIGCLRTLDEITRWGRAGDDAKRAILAAVARRRGEQVQAGGAVVKPT